MDLVVEPELTATISIYGKEAVKKFRGYDVGDTIGSMVIGTLSSISEDNVTLKITDLTIKTHAQSFDEAVKRAKNEVYHKSNTEPSVG